MSARWVVVAAASAILLLAGCTTAPAAQPSVSPVESAAATPPVFTQPTHCEQLVPSARLDVFTDAAIILLGGPGGLYGDHYLAEPTPEQDAGGITCIWGDDTTEISSVTISVAPLDSETHELVVDTLLAQGLNEVSQQGYSEYAEAGDEEGSATIYNAVRDESWISVIQTVCGEASFADAVAIADEVYASVYR